MADEEDSRRVEIEKRIEQTDRLLDEAKKCGVDPATAIRDAIDQKKRQ